MAHRRWWTGTGVFAGAITMTIAAGFAAPALAAAGPVSSRPASGTPQMA